MKKRILIIAEFELYPPNAGNKIRVKSLVENLQREGHEVWYLGLGLNAEQAASMQAVWRDHFQNVPRLRLRHVRPRWYALLRHLSDRLVPQGISNPGVDHWFWPHWDEAIAKFAAAHDFEVVIVQYVFNSKALLHFPASTFKIIDTHDVFAGRREKLQARNIKRFWRYLPNAGEERKGLDRADVVVGIQENETAHFRQLLGPTKRVVTVGHTVDLQPIPRASGHDLLFLGSDNAVNVDGITHFIEHCFPLIRAAIPDARLLLAGGISLAVRPAIEGIESLGTMDDVKAGYAKASIVINPVVVGTGLKTKTIEALAFGLPLVTTSCGADGLLEAAGSAYSLADDSTEFADAVITLLKNPAQADALGQGALQFIEHWNTTQFKALREAIELVR